MNPYCDHFDAIFDDSSDFFTGFAEGADVTAAEIVRALGYTPADVQAVEDLRATVATKADKTEVEALAAIVDTKADKTEVEALAAIVDTKADKSDLDKTNRDVEFLKLVTKDVNWTKEEREENGHATLPKGGLFGNIDEVRGKTEQETTNGYQLINGAELGSTVNGVVYSNLNNASAIKVSGTASADAYLSEGIRQGTILQVGFFVEAGTYTFSVIEPLPVGVRAQILSSDGTYSPTSSAFGSLSTTTNSITATLSTGVYCYPRLVVLSGASVNGTFHLMLEKGSTAHPYEKFSGGIPSPNPDYPSEIVSVDSINILHTDTDGIALSARTIIPPRPLNAIGEYKDKLNVVSGEWEYGCIDVDLGTLAWGGTQTSRYSTREPLPNAKLPVGIDGVPNAMCTRYRVVKYTDEEAGKGLTIVWETSYAAGQVWVKDAAANPTEFTNAVRGAHLIYAADNLVTEPIAPKDLDYLRNLTLNAGENLFITDNHGRDVSYLMSDFINLKEALA